MHEKKDKPEHIIMLVEPSMGHLTPLHMSLAERASVPPYTTHKRCNPAYHTTEYECYPFYKQISRCIPLEPPKRPEGSK